MRSFTLISVYLLRIEDHSGDLFTIRRPVEARGMAGMAGGTDLFHLIEDCVCVAVDEYAADSVEMSAFLSFLPEFLPAPAIVMCVSGGPGEFQCQSVCVGEHQDIAGPSLLHDDRHQSVIVELYLHIDSHSCKSRHDDEEDISYE